MKVLEQIAVEGPRDVAAMQRAGFLRCIPTHGFAMVPDTRRRLMSAARGRGLIVFTDPDAAGATIRQAIVDVVGPCKHAWLREDEARDGDRIGVECASPEAIQAALAAARLWRRTPGRAHTASSVAKWGLEPTETARIHALCEELRIGHGLPERLPARLNRFGITEKELQAALETDRPR